MQKLSSFTTAVAFLQLKKKGAFHWMLTREGWDDDSLNFQTSCFLPHMREIMRNKNLSGTYCTLALISARRLEGSEA